MQLFCYVFNGKQLQKSLKLAAKDWGLRQPPYWARNHISKGVLSCVYRVLHLATPMKLNTVGQTQMLIREHD